MVASRSSLHIPVVLFIPVVAAIISVWWWLGAPIALPPSPLGPGEKLYCMSYSPFRDRQTPFDRTLRIDARQIDDDLARLAPLTDCVRTYSTELGLDHVAAIAERHGLKVIQGVWLGRERERNRAEIESAVAIAKAHPGTVRSIVAGNEVLLRGELSASDLAGLIREIKDRVAVPVTYADVWEFWLRNRAVAEAVDFVTIHILPYWEDIPITAEGAAQHVAAIRRMVADAFPGKEILLGEVGWPSAGRMREGALPSPVNQARVIEDVLAVARRAGFRASVIEAFDQPWKRQLEGTVGGHWGLLDGGSRARKFTWGEPLSNHPAWLSQAVVGVTLAVAIFLCAGRARRGASTAPSTVQWFGVAGIALLPSILMGWAVADVPLESLGIGGWIHSLAMLAVALIAPMAGAAALVTGVSVPAFSQILGQTRDRALEPLALFLGVAWIVLCVLATEVALGLAFDPRYRDFPFAPLGAAVAPFVVLMLLGAGPTRRRELAETVMGAVLVASIAYVVWHEGLANWQALCLCAVLAGVSFVLLRPDARSSQ